MLHAHCTVPGATVSVLLPHRCDISVGELSISLYVAVDAMEAFRPPVSLCQDQLRDESSKEQEHTRSAVGIESEESQRKSGIY